MRSSSRWRCSCSVWSFRIFRACHAETHRYSFWDYQAGAWQKDHGIRIDHILLSPQAVDRLKGSGIDKHVRGGDKPSDHVPVWCEVEI